METPHTSAGCGEIRCVPHLKVVLVGGRNSGKSLVGNILLGREEFVPRERTACSRKLGGAAGGQPVTVVDSPGWWCDFSVHDTPQQVKREIRQSVALCLPGGPHAFLLVVKATSAFLGKRCRAVEEHLALLGEGVWSYCLVVFTRRGWPKNSSAEQHMEIGGSALRWLGEKCGGRCHAVDLEGGRDDARVAGLFEKIKRLVIENGGGHFEMGGRILQEMEERKRTVEHRAQQRFMKMKRQRSLLQRESRHLRDIRIVLLGARWSGKSSAGNAILGGGGGSFATGGRRTARCATRAADVSGRRVTVVDTPGWWMNYFSEETTAFDRREVVRGLSLCPPGPNALLLVVRSDRAFTEMYRRAVQEHVELIGDRVWTRVMVVFSFGDWLGETAVEQYIESEGDALRWLVDKCGNRYHVLDNKSDGNGFQIAELMGKIEEMVAGDGGGHFEIRGNVLQELAEEMRTEEERAAERLKRTKRQRDIARSLGELHCPSELILVLLGTANTGKSSAGNTILGREQFDAGSRTLGCVEGRGVIRGHSVTVLDTPGQLCAPPEFPASAVVIPLVVVNASSSFTRSQRRAIEERLEAFGEEAWSRAVVLFTFGDWLGDTSVERRIESEGQDLRSLVDGCGNRYHVLDNKNRGTGGQVGELLEKIAEMMAEERLEVGGQVGRSIRMVRETQFDGGTRQGKVADTPPSYTENPHCDASEVAGLVNLLPPVRSEEPGVSDQMVLALPGATGGWSTPAQLLLDREGVVSRLASLLRGSEGPRWGAGGSGGGGQTLANVQNFPDAWLRTEYRLDRVRRRRSGNPVGPFGPVVVWMRAEQSKAEDTAPVERRKEFANAQALITHPGSRDSALRERVRSGGLQALIDQWGNSNLEELESFIDSYFQRVWEETMNSVMTEEESVADGNRGLEDDVVEEEPGAGGLSSIDGRLSRQDIVETMQGDLVELKQILECSLKIIQDLNDRCTTVKEPSV